MKQLALLFALLVGMIVFSAWLGKGGLDQFNLNSLQGNRETIKVAEVEVEVEIADTDEERDKGLSGRSSLAENRGMLFVMPEDSQPSFYMFDMKFALDFIWIDNEQVIGFTENVEPPADNEEDNLPTYEPSAPVDYVLEVNAGFIAKNKIEIGNKVELPQSLR